MADAVAFTYHARTAGIESGATCLSAGRRDTRAYSYEEGSP